MSKYRLEQSSRKKSNVLIAAVAAVVLLGAAKGGYDEVQSDLHHSTDYLKKYEPQPIIVQQDQTPQVIADIVNGRDLSGQLLQDEEDFIREQGTLKDQSGQAMLNVGDHINVPFIPRTK